jgi:hypothetical protein
MRLPRSALRAHLRAAIRKQERRLSTGLAMRCARPWDALPSHDKRTASLYALSTERAEYEPRPEWVLSPRKRFHHGLRATIAKLRTARAHLAEFDSMRGAA